MKAMCFAVVALEFEYAKERREWDCKKGVAAQTDKRERNL